MKKDSSDISHCKISVFRLKITAVVYILEVLRLVANGTSKVDVAKQLGIGEATVYRILKNKGSSE